MFMGWDLIGHAWAAELLAEHIAQQQIRHAYLITGPLGVGRRTLALRLSQAVNCLQPPAPGQPCRVCSSCQQIERMQHPDLAIVQSEPPSIEIKIDQIRQLQRTLALAPYQANYRVALLLRFEEARENAANALLKTLEEPASRVILVLTAESAEILPSTIVSRCEHLRLRPVPVKLLSEELHTQHAIPPDMARKLAHISAGRPGYAIRLSQDEQRLAQRTTWLDEHARMLSSTRVERFVYAEAVAKDKDTLRSLLPVWASLWRDVVLHASGASVPFTNIDREAEIITLAERFGLKVAVGAIESLEYTSGLIDQYVNARLAAEVLMLDLPRQWLYN